MTEADRIEVGLRAAGVLRAENYGLSTQRVAALHRRLPEPRWVVQYEGDVPVRMVWGVPCWEPDT
jgi:hypothetical protein